eukprot:6176626-Pleurochrysis_carterae.AAC.2
MCERDPESALPRVSEQQQSPPGIIRTYELEFMHIKHYLRCAVFMYLLPICLSGVDARRYAMKNYSRLQCVVAAEQLGAEGARCLQRSLGSAGAQCRPSLRRLRHASAARTQNSVGAAPSVIRGISKKLLDQGAVLLNCTPFVSAVDGVRLGCC